MAGSPKCISSEYRKREKKSIVLKINSKSLMSSSPKSISSEYQKLPGSSLLFSLPRAKQSLKPQKPGQLIHGKMKKKPGRHIKYLASFSPTVIKLAKIWNKCFLFLKHSLICA